MKKKLIDKWSKIQYVCFALAFAGIMSACSDDETPPINNAPTPEELAEMAAVDKFAAANSVYRALGLLNELPDNWEGITYTPEVGVPVDEANADIRNVISTGADHAEQYFLSIVPDEGLNGNTWSHEGVGSLTYRAVNESNCYAVIDVNLTQMPGLKQLRFVPEAVVGENSFSGTPYYSVGDIVKDKKGIIWICVRPAGGPLKKDYAYFVSFAPSLINTTSHKQDIYNVDDYCNLTENKNKNLSGSWKFATNLVEERIAIAAGHTFAMFFGSPKKEHNQFYQRFKPKALHLKNQGVMDFAQFLKIISPTINIEENTNSFMLAYGSCQKNNYMDKRQEKYLQPLLYVTHKGLNNTGTKILEEVSKVWYDREIDTDHASPYLHSLTMDYEPYSFEKLIGLAPWGPEGDENAMGYYDGPFNIMNYTTGYTGVNDPIMPERLYLNNYESLYVMLLTQKSVKDNGKPYSGFTKLCEIAEFLEPDYWESLDMTERQIFDKDKHRVIVNNIYE